MAYIIGNSARSTLAAGITDVATSLSVQAGHGTRFPTVAAPNISHLTLSDAAGNIEHVKVTTHGAASDSVAVIERGQDGTSARAWNSGDVVEFRLIKAGLDAIKGETVEVTTNAATSKATPVDADLIPLVDSAASNVLKKLTWANLKATLSATLTSLTALTSINRTGGTAITGTNTNDSAAAGCIGEYVESIVGPVNAPATGTYGDLTSITLSAGDWDVSANALAPNTGGVTYTGNASIGIGTASGNSSSGLVSGSTSSPANPSVSSYDSSMAVPTLRKSLSGSTTIYLKMRQAYSAGTPVFYGRISARRVR